MTRIVLLTAFAASLLVFAPSIVKADPITPVSLPDAVASGSISIPISAHGSFSFTDDTIFPSGNSSRFTYGPSPQTVLFASTFAGGGLDPNVSANLILQNVTPTEIMEGDLNNLGSQSDFSYSFMVNGPASTLVPIDISATGSASAAPTPTNGGVLSGGGATAELSIFSTSSVLLDDFACAGFVGAGCNSYPEPSFSIDDQVFDVETNQVYTVDLSAETVFPAAMYDPPVDPPPVGTGLLGYNVNAYIDPTIVLDPSVGSQYSLSFSSNLAPTPEPNYLLLMPVCLGGLIFCVKRSRRSSAAAQPA